MKYRTMGTYGGGDPLEPTREQLIYEFECKARDKAAELGIELEVKPPKAKSESRSAYYGKIDFLGRDYDGKTIVGETLYYRDKKSFMEEVSDSIDCGRPIKSHMFNPSKLNREDYINLLRDDFGGENIGYEYKNLVQNLGKEKYYPAAGTGYIGRYIKSKNSNILAYRNRSNYFKEHPNTKLQSFISRIKRLCSKRIVNSKIPIAKNNMKYNKEMDFER